MFKFIYLHVSASLLTEASEIFEGLRHLKCSFAVGGQTGKMFKDPASKLMLEKIKKDRLKLEKTLIEFRSGDINCKYSAFRLVVHFCTSGNA